MDKINILDWLGKGEIVVHVAKALDINEKNEKNIRSSFSTIAVDAAKRLSHVQDGLMQKMENSLIIWIEYTIDKHIPLSASVIKQKNLQNIWLFGTNKWNDVQN